MITLSSSVRIYLATGAVDLRKSIDGLGAIVSAPCHGGFRVRLRCEAETRTLHPLRHPASEDSVYVSPSCERSLADRGLRIASS